MAGLQRSEISFRRQGSSGLVWDDKFLAGALSQVKPNNDQEEEEEEQRGKGEAAAGEAAAKASSESPAAAAPAPAPAPITEMKRSRSNREGGQAYKTVQVAPAADPPSPKVSGCGFCGAFGKPVKSHRRTKPGKRKS